MHGKAPLSVQTRDWLERWLKLIGDRKPALIVLLRRRETNRAAASTMVYLRKIADQHKISFYLQAGLDLS
jgi:predicted transcriptional regulator